MPRKSQNQYRHFVKRFHERTGIKLTKPQYLELVNKVIANEFKLIRASTLSERFKFYAVTYKSIEFIGLYDPKFQRLVTAYTKEMFHRKGAYKFDDTYWKTNIGGNK